MSTMLTLLLMSIGSYSADSESWVNNELLRKRGRSASDLLRSFEFQMKIRPGHVGFATVIKKWSLRESKIRHDPLNSGNKRSNDPVSTSTSTIGY